jgi:uncharacterized protein (UPF0297 family)
MKLLNFIKTVYRLFRYKAEWNKQFREVNIRKNQNANIRKIDPRTEKLILFFIPGADYYSGKESISGGLISIISLAQETAKIFEGSDTTILIATYYNHHLINNITSFENQSVILSPKLIENYFKNVKSLILHIPELYVEDFVLNQLNNKWLNKIQNVQINILNQSIQLMPEMDTIEELKKRFKICTITTAHTKYCNLFYRNKFGVPTHLLSVWISKENYIDLNYRVKENLILFSPDNPELTDLLIVNLKKSLPQFNYEIIKGLKYEYYKELICRAKFVITTGEGLDAYFIETYFSGGVSLAIKNSNFFDDKYLNLPCLFDDDTDISEFLVSRITEFDNEGKYHTINQLVTSLLSIDYSYENYIQNLKHFYREEYTYK